MAKFPGDPRFSVALLSTRDDLKMLESNEMLPTHLLDYLIQRCAPKAKKVNKNIVCCGSTHSYFTFCRSNELIKKGNTTSEKVTDKSICTMRNKMKAFRMDRHTIIIPHVSKQHFFVVFIATDNSTMKKERVFLKIICYDSLRYSSRRGIPVQSTLGEFLIESTEFWNNFVVHEFLRFDLSPKVN